MSAIFFSTLLLTIPITILITWIVINKRIISKAKINECPYRHACEKYDAIETKAAAKRIAHLLIENIESENAYKQAIRIFIEKNDEDSSNSDSVNFTRSLIK
jgi:putative component of membrane protein insertase Oxa1/YidC/SpoIIIJ protein YidD